MRCAISSLILILIILTAIITRVCGLGHDLPYPSYIEEDEFIYTAMKYGTGDLDPHWYFHPPLYSYLLFASYGVYYGAGAVTGLFSSREHFALHFLTSPTPFYLIARLLSLAFFLLALYALYRLVSRISTPGNGLAAGACFAAMPLATVYSLYGSTEPLLLLFTILTAHASVSITRQGRIKDSIIGGCLAGIATATKYTGIFTILFILVAHLLSTPRRRGTRLSTSALAAAATFLLLCPFPLINAGEYFSNIRLLLSQPLRVGEYPWMALRSHHLLFITHYLPRGMGTVLAVAALAGLIPLWARHSRSDILIATLPTSFCLVVGFSRLYYDRYMLICYPFFAAAAVIGIACVMKKVKGKPAFTLLVSAAIALPSLMESIRRVADIRLPDTSVCATQWIVEHLPEGTPLLVDSAPVPQSGKSILREHNLKRSYPRRDYGYRDFTETYFELQLKAAQRRKGFGVVRILHPRGFHMVEEGRGYEEEWMTPEKMKELITDFSRYDYALLSMRKATRYAERALLPARFRFMHDFYRRVKGEGMIEKIFKAEKGVCEGETFILYRFRE